MNKDFKIHFLNTIWSDAIILESNGHFAMIDTASDFYYPMIQDYIKDNNIEKLDFVLLTHFHSDHYGNLEKLYNDYKIDKLYIKEYTNHEGSTGDSREFTLDYLKKEKDKYDAMINAALKNSEVVYLNDDGSNYLSIPFENVTLELYDVVNHIDKLYNDPNQEFYHQNRFNENFNSIAIFVKHNGYNIYLGSDVTNSDTSIPELHKLSEKIVRRIYKEHNIRHIDVYKSCHHGGSGTNNLPLTKLLKSKYCIVTNTDRWFDTYTTRDNLIEANKNVEILKTDHYQYVFDFSKSKISYKKIENESLFITLNKD